MPCRQPLDMPTGFLDSSVPKNQTLNFTIFALEDVLLKVRTITSNCIGTVAVLSTIHYVLVACLIH